MPSMDGPARGLRKTVWSISPDAARPAPARSAVTACGTRLPSTMYSSASSPCVFPDSIPHTSSAGISMAPKNTFAHIRASVSAASMIIRIILPESSYNIRSECCLSLDAGVVPSRAASGSDGRRRLQTAASQVYSPRKRSRF